MIQINKDDGSVYKSILQVEECDDGRVLLKSTSIGGLSQIQLELSMLEEKRLREYLNLREQMKEQ